ncbi:hypothetical protein U8607_06180 [Methylobacterium durans]|uniref:hypothetical protein n=1 Tax=Methylobacterium durans TaxID=2202825 RepID=UPI002AFDEE21|nr:hypothetical protein [Methylobacterium durans]MEA1831668.1 hypothetical protein [Methylobacterium durans]
MRSILSALVLLGLSAAPALAGPDEDFGTRYRGTVETREGDVLTLRLRAGGTAAIRMNDTTRLLTAAPATVRDIKPESYVSALSVPECGTARRAEAVTIYAPDLRGWFSGHRSWDTMPDAALTGGWIGDLSGDDPRRVVLNYEGGTKTVTVAADTKATQITRGEKALLIAGAEVTAFVAPDEAGKPVAEIIAVGRRGAVPSL